MNISKFFQRSNQTYYAFTNILCLRGYSKKKVQTEGFVEYDKKYEKV